MNKPMTTLDLNYVRGNFPAFSAPSLEDQRFFENAGGSYMSQQVINRFTDYFENRRVQPYYSFEASKNAGSEMDLAYIRFAEYLNVDASEILFGPSTSQNTYVIANALKTSLREGDTVIVSGQEHEANSGAWRQLSKLGVNIRTWPINKLDGRLNLEDLNALMDPSVRIVAVTHCSNIVGEINPVSKISKIVHSFSSILIVDGVSFCPHGLPDIEELGADIYLFSTYKVYGPHQGVMVVRASAKKMLSPQSHYFTHSDNKKWLVPAGPDHAQIAASNGIIDYFDQLDAHHHGQNNTSTPRRVEKLLRNAEQKIMKPLLEFVSSRDDLRLIGSTKTKDRAPTISFVSDRQSSRVISEKLSELGIMSGSGSFYANRLLQELGISQDDGVVRLSCVHYTSGEDVEAVIKSLGKIL